MLSGSTSAARASRPSSCSHAASCPRGRSSETALPCAYSSPSALPCTGTIRRRTVSCPLEAATRSSPRSSITTSSVPASSSARPRSAISRSSHNSDPESIGEIIVSIVSRPFSRRAAALVWASSSSPSTSPCQAAIPTETRSGRRCPPASTLIARRRCERAPGDDLPARPVGAGQQHRELALAGPPDAVEAAQLVPQRLAHVDERLLGQLARRGLASARRGSRSRPAGSSAACRGARRG